MKQVAIEGGMRTNGLSERKKPYFTIVTVTFNNKNALEQCVNTIRNQSFKDFEIIVIDGASTDGSQEWLQDNQSMVDYFISEPDAGIYNAINKGIKYAQGSVVGLIHSDDILSFNSLSRYYEAFENGNYDAVVGDCIYFNENREFNAYKPSRNYGIETIFRGITAAHETIFIKKDVYNRLGPYDETYRSAADYKLISKLVMGGYSIGSTKNVEVYKLVGGESFGEEVEFNENYKLAREYCSNLSENDYRQLLKLKNYKHLTRSDLEEIYSIVTSLNANHMVLRSLALTFLVMALGDNPTTSFNRIGLSNIPSSTNYENDRVLFGIVAIKSVPGGAERVLLDVASYLADRGKQVLITSADGKAGVPKYGATSSFDLIDIFEPPYNVELESNVDLKVELAEIISKMPDEVLAVAINCKLYRDQFSSWGQFSQLCMNASRRSAQDMRELLLSEVDTWIGKFGGRVRRWRSLIYSYKPGVVVPFMISATTQMFIAARKTPSKIVISNHGNPIRDYLFQDDWDDMFLDRALRLFSILSADKVQWLQSEFLQSVPTQTRRRSIVVPNAIPVRSEVVPANDRERIILGVGRLHSIKRFDLLIEAFSLAKNDLEGWKVHIYGEGNEYVKLANLISKHGLESVVVLKGFASNIDDIYSRSSMLVSCSEMEGFPMTVSEALASGMPVIGPRETSGINNLVLHGKNGLLVERNEEGSLVENMASAMIELALDSNLRARFSEFAISSMTKFAPDEVFKQWEALIFD
ncbi:glycosyltransferase [Microbulbifer sp. CAU 1566]|uniref:glycosyltransferase n=1 Tax=Microbulbifer sp. CAU 1566 TaxID=2933269 RepID=UPI0020043C00|nr:glycosyltransferase [Microbulbifer sp. CAU 1566]MCK7597358.1 glycosyltransferase [Microbulbifer sp. CAU 1566]